VRRARGALPAAALALITLAVAGCGDEDSPGGTTTSDGVVPGRVSTEVNGQAARVVVPAGTLSITVGDPLTGAVPSADAEDGEQHTAPDGRSWVPVSWSFDALAAFPGQAVVSQQPQPAEVTAEDADGDAVELPAPYTVDGVQIGDSATSVFYLPVVDPDQLSIDVTYDGTTQRLDTATGEVDEGAAAPLYGEVTGARELDCGDGARIESGAASATLSCEMAVERVPYLPGTGWADEGRSFAVVGASFSSDGAESVTATVTVDGQPAIEEVTGSFGETDAGDAAQTLQAFDAPASGGEAVVDVTVRTAEGPIDHEVSVALP